MNRAIILAATFVFTAVVAALLGVVIYIGTHLTQPGPIAFFYIGMFCALWRAVYLTMMERETR